VTPAELLESLTTPPWDPIGRSVEGRPLVARSLPGASDDTVLFFGAIHGDEPLGAFLTVKLFDELAAQAPLPRTAWFLPVANPDGFLIRRKENARGVDLNRNYPASNWRPEHKPRYFPGESAASEPETQALMALIERVSPSRIISLHSPYRTVNYDGPSLPLAERMAARNGYGASADIGYPTPGSFGSLYGVECQLEVITLEIPPMPVEKAWAENREALLVAVDLLP
jgi:murein peptide amidase A